MVLFEHRLELEGRCIISLFYLFSIYFQYIGQFPGKRLLKKIKKSLLTTKLTIIQLPTTLKQN